MEGWASAWWQVWRWGSAAGPAPLPEASQPCPAPFFLLSQALEHAIGEGLQRVEAGAQGEHKIQRGYVPRWVGGWAGFRCCCWGLP